MFNRLKRAISEKGQGLTEYVLILAFIAGVAFPMFGGNGSLKGTLVNTFTETQKILAGLFDDGIKYADAVATWGKKNKADLSGEISNEKRIAMDQESLANIGAFFLNKTKTELATLMNNYTYGGDEGIFLVNYHDNSDIETDFDYSGSNLKAGYQDILTYMQGDASDIVSFSSDTRYFYSDNMLVDKEGQYGNDRSIRVNLHYNADDVVDAVRVRVNRGSTKGAGDSNIYYRELDVKVGTGQSWKQTISGDAGTITKNESNSVKKTWYDLNNW